MRIPAALALALAAEGTGCTQRSGGPNEPPAHPTTPCGPIGDRLDAYAWLPTQSRVVASIDLAHPDREAAIERLSAHARGDEHGLPIDVAFALGQWSWQLPLIEHTLGRAGFEPGELAYARLSTGSSAWVWATRCDFDEATARMGAAWGVTVRRTAGGAVGTAAPTGEDTPAFAYDVVVLPADRAALVPAGGATEFLRALTDRPEPPAHDATPPGALLEAVPAAPVRLVVQGEALLAQSGAPPRRALTVDAGGIEAATLPPS